VKRQNRVVNKCPPFVRERFLWATQKTLRIYGEPGRLALREERHREGPVGEHAPFELEPERPAVHRSGEPELAEREASVHRRGGALGVDKEALHAREVSARNREEVERLIEQVTP
jgi:hypothetical protein